MPGLEPGICLIQANNEAALPDGRVKPGHDEVEFNVRAG
jgi:hypothetical protein